MASLQAVEQKASPYITRIENVMADRASERGESMARCKAFSDDIKEIYKEAKSDGLAVKSLKALIKRREWERDIDALPAGLDIDEQSQYQELVAVFAMSGAGAGAGDDEHAGFAEDVEPGYLEKAREDEVHLLNIGQGKPKRKKKNDALDGLAQAFQ